MKKKGHLVKNWKERFVVVTDDKLSYYVDAKMTKKKGEISLNKSTRVLTRDGRTHPWKFGISDGNSFLELSAASEKERSLWVRVLKVHLGIEEGREYALSMSSVSQDSEVGSLSFTTFVRENDKIDTLHSLPPQPENVSTTDISNMLPVLNDKPNEPAKVRPHIDFSACDSDDDDSENESGSSSVIVSQDNCAAPSQFAIVETGSKTSLEPSLVAEEHLSLLPDLDDLLTK